MAIYDISMEIHEEMMVYKNKKEKRPVRKITLKHDESGVNESLISMNLHTGTHIDAPFHMLADGKTIEELGIEKFIGQAYVFDMTHVSKKIDKEDLEGLNIPANAFVLLKTRNSFASSYENDFVFLGESGAEYLKNKNIRGVGIDALGIERNQPGHPTHGILMKSGCIIIEGLRLKDISKGKYMMYAFPLKIRNGDAAPARVMLEDV